MKGDRIWNIRELSEEEQALAQQLSKELKISFLSARLLVVRGLKTADEARQYIRPNLDELNDPFLMRDMDKAVERIERAIRDKERIMVYGDYDVDGTTAVALMYTFLSSLTSNLQFYIPDRFKEGYGISFQGIDQAHADGCTLIVALDCGIKSVDKVEYAKKYGIDFVICDHHTPGEEIPDAVAVLNMKRKDCPYPYKELCGCGVGFKLVQAYVGKNHLAYDLKQCLPLLALAIASDIMPVTGENRVLAHYGLKELSTHPSIGLAALIEVAGLKGMPITMTDIGFKIGPRINACGRLYSGSEAVKMLLTSDVEQAQQYARDIDAYNIERRQYEMQIVKEALEMLDADGLEKDKHTTVVYKPDWHSGVVGIAAGKLTENYFRPTIVLTRGESGILTGSARSAGGFDIYSAIDSCRDLLTNFGGHAFAAGLSLKEDNLPEFKERFEQYVAQHIRPEQMIPKLEAEVEVKFADITPQLMSVIRCLEPFGPENPRPVFVTRNVINHRYTKRVGKEGEHLHLDVTDTTAAITGVAFGFGDLALYMQNGKAVDLCYELNENVFNGIKSTQVMVKDMKEVGRSAEEKR